MDGWFASGVLPGVTGHEKAPGLGRGDRERGGWVWKKRVTGIEPASLAWEAVKTLVFNLLERILLLRTHLFTP